MALFVTCPGGGTTVDRTWLRVVDPSGPSVSQLASGLAICSFAALSPDGTRLAVTDAGSSYSVIQLFSLPSLTPLGPFAMLSQYGSRMVWSPDSQTVYVRCAAAIMPVSRAGVVGDPISVDPVNFNDAGICASTTFGRLYTTTLFGVAEIDPGTGTQTRSLPMPSGDDGYSGAWGVTISPDNATLFVTCRVWLGGGSNTIGYRLVDVLAGTVSAPVTTQSLFGQPQTLDAHRVVVAGRDRMLVADPTTNAYTASVTGFSDARDFCFSGEGGVNQIWVTDQTAGNVTPINAATFTVSAPPIALDGGATPIGITGVGFVGPATATSVTFTVGPIALTLSGVISGTGTGGGPGTGTIIGSAVLMAGPVVLYVPTHFTALRLVGTAQLPLGPLRLFAIAGRIGPGAWPVPGYRGRWRLTLHQRKYAPATLMSTIIAELTEARGRKLAQAWNTPATLTFTLDGQSDAAQLIEELLHDVVAWRWDDQTGTDIPMFRGIVAQSDTQLTTEAHAVTFTCHDYAAMLDRRITTTAYAVTGRDQDVIVGDLLARAMNATNSFGLPFTPASFLPLGMFATHPDGSLRGMSGQLRDRTYYPSQNIATAIADLAAVINGFDYDVQPDAVGSVDRLRVFYPQQGVTRSDVFLQYGSTVSTVRRTVDSADYANYVRVLGNSGSSDPNVQKFSDNWAPEAVSAAPTVGLWMTADNAANVTVQTTLDDKSVGDVLRLSDLEPGYTLGLTPDTYTYGHPNMGDTVPLVVQSGRLNVNTAVRVLGITYDIGDDGTEDIQLVVGRPAMSLARLFRDTDRSIKALDLR